MMSNILFLALILQSNSEAASSKPLSSEFEFAPFIESDLPEEDRLLLEASLARLLRMQRKTSAAPNSSSSTNTNDGSHSEPRVGTLGTDSEPEEQSLEELVLETLERAQEDQRKRLSQEELRRLEAALKNDRVILIALEKFLAAPFDPDSPSQKPEFLRAEGHLINLLFFAPETSSNRRHFIVSHYRLRQPDALLRFAHFEKVMQARYDEHAVRHKGREKVIAGLITVAGTAAGLWIGWRYYKSPVAADARLPAVQKILRHIAVVGLPVLGYKLGSTFSVEWAPLLNGYLSPPKESFSNDPLYNYGDLSELILLDQELSQ